MIRWSDIVAERERRWRSISEETKMETYVKACVDKLEALGHKKMAQVIAIAGDREVMSAIYTMIRASRVANPTPWPIPSETQDQQETELIAVIAATAEVR
jgi:hypothetical protein